MRVCLFDIDGTLVNTGGAGQAAMEAGLARNFGVSGPAEGISTAGRTDRAITEDLLAFHGLPVGEAAIARFLDSYLEGLPGELARLDGRPLPGVRELLSGLSAREDVVLGLLTGNFIRGARHKLSHFGLDTFFDLDEELFGGFGDHDRNRDDVARRGREAVRSRLQGWDPAEVWVIGDTPLDVQCARAISVRVLAVATGMFSKDELARSRPDVLLDDLSSTGDVVSVLLE
ncbi:MAG: haloacid dehalogenase [Planctomycetaceae bacterium]|jgi:phosphoglycolate phosphatase-like HAD superfamily hydrolase|nr:haloacid dehalogenase [Planctomycetaceae bacterium]MDP7273914.1 haloacid dehalogenase-like hydrolase [Planctomycetaceae bacterium]